MTFVEPDDRAPIGLRKQPEQWSFIPHGRNCNRRWAEANGPETRSKRTAAIVGGAALAASIAVLVAWRPFAPSPSARPRLAQPTRPPAAELASASRPLTLSAPATAMPSPPSVRLTTTARGPSPAVSAVAESGPYWVQVGAFTNFDAAKRLAAELRGQHYRVEELSDGAGKRETPGIASRVQPSSGGAAAEKYDVFVAGGSPAELTAKLSAKGVSTEPASDGVVVRPSLPLGDAMALSKDLAAEGWKIQVRRSGSQASTTVAPSLVVNGRREGFHRVRVGPYQNRAAATSALKELEAKGYKAFSVRG